MPMNTILVSARSSFDVGHSPSASRAIITCVTISAAERLRTSFWVPVWQNVQFKRAADLARHAERAGAADVGDEHAFGFDPGGEPDQPFTRAVLGNLLSDDLGPGQRVELGQSRAQLLGHIGHLRKFSDAIMIDPAPELFSAHLRLSRLDAGGEELFGQFRLG